MPSSRGVAALCANRSLSFAVYHRGIVVGDLNDINFVRNLAEVLFNLVSTIELNLDLLYSLRKSL